ncbi:MAG: twin transmembrane helix small protein [Sphingobium sp.]
MNAFLVILIIAAAIATVVTLVRGIVVFLKTTEAELNSTDTGPSQSSLKQNKMMMMRITFQAVAILLVALLLLLNGK